jgi:hypothetical protein
MAKIILPPIQNTVGICKQITILHFYHISSRLVTLLEFIYTPVQISNILILTVCFKLINFVFQIFPLFESHTMFFQTKTYTVLSLHHSKSPFLLSLQEYQRWQNWAVTTDVRET